MPKIITTCTHCQKSLRLDDRFIEKNIRCPICQGVFKVTRIAFPSVGDASDSPEALATRSQPTKPDPIARSAEPSPPNSPSDTIKPSDDTASSSGERSAKIGRYKVIKELGRGAFGVVYAAEDPILKRRVAIKLLKHRKTSADSEIFLSEARAAARLRHPNIVAIFEVELASGRPFVVSELIEGQTLAQQIEDGSCSPEQSITMVRDLARGLAHAHSQGLIHRDVKPQNILIDESGRPQITDFGLAVDRHNEDEARESAYSNSGTLAYMAPEQAGFGGASVGPAVDQYALGATLFEMLTGKRPHTGDTLEILKQLEAPQPPRMRAIAPGTHLDLDAICAKAMSHEPWHRYEGCSELADDLDRYLAGDLIRGRRITIVERVQHFAKRNPKLAPWVITGAVTAASVLLLSTILAIRSQFIIRTLKQDVATARLNTVSSNRSSSGSDSSKIIEELFPSEAVETDSEQLTENALPVANDLAMWLAYSRKLNKAAKSLAHQDMVSGQRFLQETTPAQRHWEYGVLNSDIDHRLAVWDGTADRIIPLTGGKEIALLAQNQISIHDLATGKERIRWQIPATKPGGNRNIALLNKQPILVVSDGDKLRFWNHQENRELPEMAVDVSIASTFQVSPDDKLLAGRNAGYKLAVWDLVARKPLGVAEVSPYTFAFAKDSNAIFAKSANADIGHVSISLPELKIQAAKPDEDNGSPVSDNVMNGTRVAQFEGNDTKLTAVSRMNVIELSGPTIPSRTLTLPAVYVGSLAFSAEGRFLIASFTELENKVAKPRISVWSVAQLLQETESKDATALAASFDGSKMAFGDSGKLTLMDQLTHKIMWSVDSGQGHINCIAFAPDGKSIVTMGQFGAPKLWNAADGKLIQELPTLDAHHYSAVFSPDGQRLAISAGNDFPDKAATDPGTETGKHSQIVLLTTSDWKIQHHLTQHIDRVTGLVFDSTGQRLASSGDDGLVALWDTNTGALLSQWSSPGEAATQLAFTPNDEQLAVIVVPQQARFIWVTKVETHQITVNCMQTETRQRTVSVQESQEVAYTVTVPYTEMVEQRVEREVEIEVEGKKKKVKGQVTIPVAVDKIRTETRTRTVIVPKTIIETYTVQVPVTTIQERPKIKLGYYSPAFRTKASDTPSKPRVVLLNVADMSLKAKWIPEAGRIPIALQYTADGKRLLVSTDHGISSLHPDFFFELLEHKVDGGRGFCYSEPLKQVCCIGAAGLVWLRDRSNGPQLSLDQVQPPLFLKPKSAVPAPAAPVIDPNAESAPAAPKAKPVPAKRKIDPGKIRFPNVKLPQPRVQPSQEPVVPKYEIDIVAIESHALLTNDNALVLFANPGLEFQVGLTVKYTVPSLTKLASNLLLKEANILPPEFEQELMASHTLTWHFDTESRPGYQSVNGAGEIDFELTGKAPKEKGIFNFKMNAGLFDKTNWATKILKFYPVVLVTDEQVFEQLASKPQADRITPIIQ